MKKYDATRLDLLAQANLTRDIILYFQGQIVILYRGLKIITHSKMPMLYLLLIYSQQHYFLQDSKCCSNLAAKYEVGIPTNNLDLLYL